MTPFSFYSGPCHTAVTSPYAPPPQLRYEVPIRQTYFDQHIAIISALASGRPVNPAAGFLPPGLDTGLRPGAFLS